MSTVVLYKLTTGEEIVAKFISDDGAHIILEDVRALMMQPTPQGQMGVAILPWSAGVPDGQMRIKHNLIGGDPVNLDDINSGLVKQYLSQTSGIELDTSGIQL